MDESEFRWPDGPSDAPTEPGWLCVRTPLGAALHVRPNSSAWDVCTEWRLLHAGRGRLSPTDPVQWFDAHELSRMPQGLVAELLASARRADDFARLVVADAEARAHILRLPDHLFEADLEERELVDEYVDLARRLHAREVARAAAVEASKR